MACDFTLEQILFLFEEKGYPFYCLRKKYVRRPESVFEQKTFYFFTPDRDEIPKRPVRGTSHIGRMASRILDAAETAAAFVLGSVLHGAVLGGGFSLVYLIMVFTCRKFWTACSGAMYYQGLVKMTWIPFFIGLFLPAGFVIGRWIVNKNDSCEAEAEKSEQAFMEIGS